MSPSDLALTFKIALPSPSSLLKVSPRTDRSGVIYKMYSRRRSLAAITEV
jgi:hypothetical protein